ncbi:MAG: tetratricopeptide repeat protein [Oligoflexus sp.]
MIKNWIHSLLSFLVIIGIHIACASDSTDEAKVEELDIKTQPDKITMPIEGEIKDATPEKIFEWQHHFRQAPNKQEREKIELQVQKNPIDDDQDAILKHARNLNVLGRLNEAEASYRRILRLNPKHFEAHLELAQLCLQRSEISKAFDYIVTARKLIDLQENPPKSEIFTYKYTLALAYLARDRRDEGHQILSDLIAMEPDFIPAYVALADSYLSRNQYELAEFVAKRGIDRSDSHIELMNVLGVVAGQQGDYLQARRWYDRVLEIDKEHVPTLVNRANLSLIRHEYAAAEADLNLAINIRPTFVNAHIAMGILYKRTGRFDISKTAFQQALDLDPESSFARFNLALLLAERFDDRNNALRLFYEVLQTQDETQDLKSLAKVHIHGLRQNRLDFQDKH